LLWSLPPHEWGLDGSSSDWVGTRVEVVDVGWVLWSCSRETAVNNILVANRLSSSQKLTWSNFFF